MRLLMLIPIFILMGVSGYNLAGGYNAPGIDQNNTIGTELLHMGIILVCVMAISLIVRSAFTVKYTEEEYTPKAQAQPFFQRLVQQLHL
jgi:hypothetical protein